MEDRLTLNGTEMIQKVVCIGDSITEGYGISEDSSAPYPAQLQSILGEKYRVYNQGLSCTCVTNRKLNGRTVGMPYVLQEQWKESLAIKGDIYVVTLGGNDAQNGYNEEENHPDEYNDVYAFRRYFREDYLWMMQKIREAAPNALIFSVSPVPVMECIWRKHQQIYLLDVLAKQKKIWEENPWMIPVDAQSVFMEIDYGERIKLYQNDRLHLSREGAGLLAKTIAETIKKHA